LRPLRNKEALLLPVYNIVSNEGTSIVESFLKGEIKIEKTIQKLKKTEETKNFEKLKEILIKYESLFEWQDGPLVKNIKNYYKF
jgi:midasin (ATPase involved in ribosome maturation)